MLKIFGSPMSTCTRKVLMTLAETNTPYELTTIDFAKGEHKAQPHLGRQPFGQIPAIDDEGFAMFESRAICRYVDFPYFEDGNYRLLALGTLRPLASLAKGTTARASVIDFGRDWLDVEVKYA